MVSNHALSEVSEVLEIKTQKGRESRENTDCRHFRSSRVLEFLPLSPDLSTPLDSFQKNKRQLLSHSLIPLLPERCRLIAPGTW